MGKRKVTYEVTLPLQKAVEYLRSVVDGLEGGEFTIADGGNSLSFTPLEEVDLEVELEHKAGKQELEIELSWKSADYAEEEADEDEEDEEEEEETGSVPEKSQTAGVEPCRAGLAGKVVPLAALTFALGIIIGVAVGKSKKSTADGEQAGEGEKER